MPAPVNEHPLLLPTGTEYHVDMIRIRLRCRDAGCSDRSARTDILLREEPYEEEDDDEDEGNVTPDEGDDDEEVDGGYSVRVRRGGIQVRFEEILGQIGAKTRFDTSCAI